MVSHHGIRTGHGSTAAYRFPYCHHREHIIGDYKNPPPKGMYDHKLKRSQELLVQEAVTLSMPWRKIIGKAVLDKLQKLTAGGPVREHEQHTHAHVLAKMPAGLFREKWMGQAKKHSNFIGKEHGWTGKLWGAQ